MSGFTYGNPALPSGYRVIVCKTLCLSKELPRSLMSQPFGFYPYFVISRASAPLCDHAVGRKAIRGSLGVYGLVASREGDTLAG